LSLQWKRVVIIIIKSGDSGDGRDELVNIVNRVLWWYLTGFLLRYCNTFFYKVSVNMSLFPIFVYIF